jgi:hypothetical protein
MNIYVACGGSRQKRWLINPRQFFDGRCCLVFGKTAATAGVNTSLFNPGLGAKDFKKVLVDELDRLGVPWSAPKKPRFGVRVIEGKAQELYLMDFQLAGKLPMHVASEMGCLTPGNPLGVMVRYGG